jgi:23S rRNA (adenine1618-N6)-methyltransferase
MAPQSKLHPRNQHSDGYDFARLVAQSPELEAFTQLSPAGHTSINFHDEQAVRALNRALLKTHYKINFWDIPANYLCPPIPGRVDYVHHLADLLAADNNGEIPRGRNIKVLDIGTGANLVYPLIGQSEYGWHFTGTDIDPTSIKVAQQICQFNKLKISLKLQKNKKDIFRGVMAPADGFHLTMCNPPFHASPDAASKGNERKRKNLGKDQGLDKGKAPKLNFGGQQAELWCPGGELQFIAKMIEQSVEVAEQCLWFTSLVSKKDNLKPLYKLLEKAGVAEVKTVDMAQGQKVSRFIAWSFIEKQQRSL